MDREDGSIIPGVGTQEKEKSGRGDAVERGR